MSDFRKEHVAEDLTAFRVIDRLAKIATTYTGGQVSIVYGAPPSTDSKGTIFLPTRCKAVALGTHETPGDEFEKLTWAYVNHEMGHLDVEFKLRHARSRRLKAQASPALRNLIPPELRPLGFATGDPIETPSEFLATPRIQQRAEAIVNALGGSVAAAIGQLAFLTNAAEDPRQENMTRLRWKGASEHLAYCNRYCWEKWNAQATELQESGRHRDFLVFSVALLHSIAGRTPEWAGGFNLAQVRAVSDIVDAYRTGADWETAFGWFDAVNFALAVIGRVYRREAMCPPPVTACGSCGSTNLSAVTDGSKVRVTCKDCGVTVESKLTSEDAAQNPATRAPIPSEDDTPAPASDGPSDGLDDPGEGEDPWEDSDAAEEGAEPESDPDAEEEEEDPEADPLKVGAIVRSKRDGKLYRVTFRHPDGSVDVEEAEGP